jgi:hypothetical protein
MWPAIAIQDDIGDRVVVNEPAEELRPFGQRTGIVGSG